MFFRELSSHKNMTTIESRKLLCFFCISGVHKILLIIRYHYRYLTHALIYITAYTKKGYNELL